jgi:lipopolysaccharide transport system ATP-binding protein
MYVRLAFAVAAHLEPEILIVDEVLAVGDMKFQEKCLGKMQDLSKTGRTLIFVSHNMSAIENLCSRGICLRQGNVSCTGLIDDVIADYLAYQQNNQNLDLLTNSHKRKGSGELRVIKVSIDNEEDLQNTIKIGESLNIVLTLKKSGSIYQPSIMMTIYDHMGGYIAHLNTEISGYRVNAENDITKVVCHIPCLNLVPKSYRINIAIMKDNSFIDHVVDAYSFSILEKDIFGTGKIPKSGILVIEPVWSMV